MRGKAQSDPYIKDVNHNNMTPPPEPARHTTSIHQKPRCPLCGTPIADWNPGPACFKHSPRVGAWYTSEASQALGQNFSKAQREERKRQRQERI